MTMFDLVEASDLESQTKLWDWNRRGVPATTLGGDCVEPVTGLDVSKGTSMLQAFTDRHKPYGKIISISNTEEGYERLGNLLDEVVLEAIGHYHRSLVACSESEGYRHNVLNPFQSKRAKGTKLRKERRTL
jgi:hypothetical protein